MYDENKWDHDYPPKKKGSFLLKTLGVTFFALLFGIVAGATMFGVNRAGELLFPMETTAPTPISMSITS